MIVEAILNIIKFVIVGVISIFPKIPTMQFSYLDNVFQVLSVTDLIINVRVMAVCFGVLFAVLNAQLIWGVVMWVVRKIPSVN